MNQKKIISIFSIFSFIILNSIICFNIYKTQYISKDIVRLHVVANSNSISDQLTKLKVESKIKEYFKTLNFKDKNALINTLKENSNRIIQISNQTSKQSGKVYTSSLKIGKISYDDKKSALIDMPKGTYSSICVVLGEGNGKNIWSIIFPNENTIEKIKELDTIMPGLSEIYTSNKTEDYSNEMENIPSKLLEYFKSI